MQEVYFYSAMYLKLPNYAFIDGCLSTIAPENFDKLITGQALITNIRRDVVKRLKENGIEITESQVNILSINKL